MEETHICERGRVVIRVQSSLALTDCAPCASMEDLKNTDGRVSAAAGAVFSQAQRTLRPCILNHLPEPYCRHRAAAHPGYPEMLLPAAKLKDTPVDTYR